MWERPPITKGEILEAVETSLIPGGAPTYFHGLRAIVRALAEAGVSR